MQVNNCGCTLVGIWVDAWIYHAATHPHAKLYIYSPTIYNAVALMHHRSLDKLASLISMALFENLNLTLPPLCSSCSPTAAEPSSRTSMGRRCSIVYCIELALGFHFTQRPLCNHWFSSPNLNDPTLRE